MTTDTAYQKAIDEGVKQMKEKRGVKVALYARVSTEDKDQNPESQLFALRQFCQNAGWEIYKEYIDRARAKDYLHRRAWQQLQKDARQHKFKTVLVFRLDRVFRDVGVCVSCFTDWQERGIGFKSLREDAIDTTTSQGRFILHIMAAMAEMESSVIGERVAAGMARAKAEGRVMGRKLLDINVTDFYNASKGCATVAAAVKKLNCSRIYIYKKCAELGITPQDVINGRWHPGGKKDENTNK